MGYDEHVKEWVGVYLDEAVVSSLWHESTYLFLLASSHWWCCYLRLLASIMLSLVVNFSIKFFESCYSGTLLPATCCTCGDKLLILVVLWATDCSESQASQGIGIWVLKIHENIRPKRQVLVLLSLMHSRWTWTNLSECLHTYHRWNHRPIYRSGNSVCLNAVAHPPTHLPTYLSISVGISHSVLIW